MREMFDPKYGMFSTQESERLYWFNPNPLDDDIALEEYRLIGRLIGLAIYNSVILDLHFPGALYKKLMGNVVGLADLEVVDPVRLFFLRSKFLVSGTWAALLVELSRRR